MVVVNPRFSVVLPVHNRADSVGRAAVSVLAQTFGDVELVIADAGSDDGTLDAVRTVADGRVRIIEAPDLGEARAAGMHASHGDWVAVIDPDTVARPQWLARIGRLADRTGADVITCGGTQHHRDHSRTQVRPMPEFTRPGAVVAKRVRSGDPELVSTPELLLDWFEEASVVNGSTDENRLRWATDAVATLGESPIPVPELLARYATTAGLAAARLHRHPEARRMLGLACKIHRGEFRCWARWAVASVPPIADLVWSPTDPPGAGLVSAGSFAHTRD